MWVHPSFNVVYINVGPVSPIEVVHHCTLCAEEKRNGPIVHWFLFFFSFWSKTQFYRDIFFLFYEWRWEDNECFTDIAMTSQWNLFVIQQQQYVFFQEEVMNFIHYDLGELIMCLFSWTKFPPTILINEGGYFLFFLRTHHVTIWMRMTIIAMINFLSRNWICHLDKLIRQISNIKRM